MQLDCISETLMVALFYRSCFLRPLGLWPDRGLKEAGTSSPLGSSCIPNAWGEWRGRVGFLCTLMMNGWTKRKKKSNNNEKFIPALADIWVQFNQKWLCFKLKADMDQLAFKQIRCRAHLRCWTVLVVVVVRVVGGGGFPLPRQMDYRRGVALSHGAKRKDQLRVCRS